MQWIYLLPALVLTCSSSSSGSSSSSSSNSWLSQGRAENGSTGEDLLCPTWTDRSTKDSKCKCGSSFHGRVVCNKDSHKVYLFYCYCMSYDLKLQKSLVGPCIYNCIDRAVWDKRREDEEYNTIRTISSFSILPQNKSELGEMCHRYHRRGRFCSDCEEGYSVSAFSYNLECLNCTMTWSSIASQTGLYIFLPQTTFYLLTLVFKIRITSPRFTAFILVSQVIGSHAFIRITIYNIRFKDMARAAQIAFKAIFQFYSIWNLDFFRFSLNSLCIPHIETKHAMLLELIPAFYPLFLVFLTMVLTELHYRGCRPVTVLWSPFQVILKRLQCKWDISGSINCAFGTMLVLSYYKIVAIALDQLTVGYVRDLDGNIVGLWNFYQASANMNRFNLFYLVILVLLAVMLPALMLLLYSNAWFRAKFLEKFIFKSARSRLGLHAFMDLLQGYYKDGMKGKARDHRYMAGLYLLLRLVIYLEYIWTLHSNFIPLIVTTLGAFAFLILAVQPYKDKYKIYNTVEPLFFGLLAVLFLALQGCIAALHERELLAFYGTISAILLLIPPGYLLSIILYFLVRSKFLKKPKEQICELISLVKHKRRHALERQVNTFGQTRRTTYSTIDINSEGHIEVDSMT